MRNHSPLKIPCFKTRHGGVFDSAGCARLMCKPSLYEEEPGASKGPNNGDLGRNDLNGLWYLKPQYLSTWALREGQHCFGHLSNTAVCEALWSSRT